MRVVTPLNFDWRFSEKFDKQMLNRDYDDSAFSVVSVPHTVKELPFNYFDEKDYQFVSCYRRRLSVTKEMLEKSNVLSFGAVASYAEVYVNGELAISHKGGYTAFSVDITKFLNEGENVLAVMCDSTERGDIPPYGDTIDYLCYGGIYREVTLTTCEKAHITDIFVKSLNPLDKDKKFEIKTKFTNAEKLSYDFEARLFIKGEEVGFAQNSTTTGTVILAGVVKDAKLWDLDNPNLYDVEVKLFENGKELDCVTDKFGFRKAEFRYAGFYLNGKHLKLRGLNRHQCFPYVGYAMPASMQREDARVLKEDLKVNIVRTSHYPQSQHFIRACDELGLLVFTEAPGWQHIGGAEFKGTFKRNVEEMVTQYFNHPSVVLWGVRVNESPDCDELYRETNKLAHELDDTRQTGGVRNFAGSHLFEDVYTYNDFSENGKRQPLSEPQKIAKAKVPYLVTENNGHMFPTKRYDVEGKRLEQALRHARVLNKAYSSDEYCGELGWCMFDYNTHKAFGSGDRICYHGVLDFFRIPKLAAYMFASQGATEPYMEVSGEASVGDYNAGIDSGTYVFTNCDRIEVFKNGSFMGDYTRDASPFKFLPNPPIFIPDTIGSRIERNERFTKKEAARLKRIMLSVAEGGMESLSLANRISLGAITAKYKMSRTDRDKLFDEYLGGWGTADKSYRYVGFIKGEQVIERVKAMPVQKVLCVKPSAKALVHGDTYDVASVKIELRSEIGNPLPYAFDAVELKTTGAIEVIGANPVALQGGAIGTYVKTTGKGKASLEISCAGQKKTIEFEIS